MVIRYCLLLIIFCHLPFANCVAQNKFESGMVAGFNATQYDGDSYAGYNKPGFTAGFFSRTNLSARWTFQFDILYFQKGARRNPVPSKGDPRQYALSLDYAYVPMTVRYKIKSFLFEVGTGLGALVREKEIQDDIDITGIRPFRRFDWDLVSGISYMFSESLEFGFRHSYSILPVRPHASGAVYWFNRGEYNNCLSFTLRYYFGTGKKDQ